MTLFRVHYADGTAIDVEAETPAEARGIAGKRRAGIVTKVKVVKADGHG